ncbi:MAG TPA: alcohol dehydrogenase catalytic domain-containing protein, partial [Chitinophagaceae bacterium]|nr:alcohol dehydrogenase catalytic domain-containing protein [Chitinophagaceae bacterium]
MSDNPGKNSGLGRPGGVWVCEAIFKINNVTTKMNDNRKQVAVVNYSCEKGAVELREISKPEITEDDVLLEVANVGVCGSDLHQWNAEHSWPVNYPIVLGHEFGGIIAELGSWVANWNV